MNEWSQQWDGAVARSQDEMSLQHLRSGVYPPHWQSLLKRLRELEPIGSILEVGCSTGYLALLLQKEGIRYERFDGIDTNAAAIEMAQAKFPAYGPRPHFSDKPLSYFFEDGVPNRRYDVVIDGACIMHVPEWQEHARMLGLLARRELIFSRLPRERGTMRNDTVGHGRQFAAWAFNWFDVLVASRWPQNTEMPEIGDSEQLCLPRVRPALTYHDRGYQAKGDLMRRSHAGYMATVHYDDDMPSPLLHGQSRIEAMWALGPSHLAAMMKAQQSDITYVDADYYFFGPLDEYYHEVGDAPAAIIPHNMTTMAEVEQIGRRDGLGVALQRAMSLHEAHAPLYGTYNVGMVYFDNTVQGRKILNWWAERCAEWCFARVEDGKFGDQKYLDQFPAMGAKVITNPGVGMGPWSSKMLRVWRRDDDGHPNAGQLMIGKPGEARRLLAWHFSTFRPDRWIDPVYGDCEWARPAYEEYAKAWERLK